MSTQTYPRAQPIWCAGCGHFSVLGALNSVIRSLEIPSHELMVLAGIGCSGTIQNYVGAYGYHALHGRVLPAATGVALANPNLTVVAAGGDGDGYAIGAGHLVHTFRRNPSLAYLLMNNETYGLTKGQPSPGRLLGDAGVDAPLAGPLLGLSIPSSTFVARGYAGAYDQLERLVRQALEHARSGRGFAFVEVISPCVTYADHYSRWDEVLFDVDRDPGYDPTDRAAAFATAIGLAAEGRVPVGLLFRSSTAREAARRPSPATADVDPRNPAYSAILDRYAVAGATAPAPPPEAGAPHRDTAVTLANAFRLPGLPPASAADFETDAGVPGAVVTTVGKRGGKRGVEGIACTLPTERGRDLSWLYARRDALVTILETTLGGGEVTTAFALPTAVGAGIPGLDSDRRPELHQALLELGFHPSRRWLYMTGRPPLRAERVADAVREVRPGEWSLAVTHDDMLVAEADVRLVGSTGIVTWLGVAEAMRGQGLGRRLYEHAAHLLGTAGAERIALFVVDDEEHRPAIRLYERACLTVAARLAAYDR